MASRTRTRTSTIDTNARRTVRIQLKQAFDKVALADDGKKAYITQLEKVLFKIWHHSQAEYINNARKLVHAVGLSLSLPLQFEPDALCALDTVTLGQGTPMAAKRDTHWQKRAEFAQLLTADMDKELEFDTDEDAIRCPRCKSNRVITKSAQQRAADEGMTNSGQCLDCHKRFAINS